MRDSNGSSDIDREVDPSPRGIGAIATTCTDRRPTGRRIRLGPSGRARQRDRRLGGPGAGNAAGGIVAASGAIQ